jgi:hypothetical protein
MALCRKGNTLYLVRIRTLTSLSRKQQLRDMGDFNKTFDDDSGSSESPLFISLFVNFCGLSHPPAKGRDQSNLGMVLTK